MTTRAGLIGLVAGIAATVLLAYPCYTLWVPGMIAGLVPAAALMVAAGRWAAAWCGATTLHIRIRTGMLAGGLAAGVLFCSLGAATATALAGQTSSFDLSSQFGWMHYSLYLEEWLYDLFWGLGLAGMILGGLGGSRPVRRQLPEIENPQMALNVSLAALPATAAAILLTVGVIGVWKGQVWRQLEPDIFEIIGPQRIIGWPIVTGGLFYLGAQAALFYVTKDETRRITHRCGLDEVRMAAFVGLFTPPALLVLLGSMRVDQMFISSGPKLITDWLAVLIGGAAVISIVLWLLQWHVLLREIFPRRSGFPPPAEGWEAIFFGTIANTRRLPLALLCLGCGIAIASPIYITIGALLISLSGGADYTLQAGVGLGSSLAVTLVLTMLYFFYRELGRRVHFRRKE